MPEYIFNGRGKVGETSFRDLSEFEQGYIEALFFTESEYGTTRHDRFTVTGKVRKKWKSAAENGYQQDIPGDYGFSDLSPEALAKIRKDCADFLARLPKTKSGSPLLDSVIDVSDYTERRAGNDFWYTRQGHGTGFFDRDLGQPGDFLTDAASLMREDFPYIGDDGKVYL